MKNIIKQKHFNTIYLGGPKNEIETLNFSLYNFNQRFNSDLIEMSDDFFYFITTEKDYIKARARNIHFNCKLDFDTGDKRKNFLSTLKVRRICNQKAKKEFDGIKEESFVVPYESSFNEYSFGKIVNKLSEVNLKEDETKFEVGIKIEEINDSDDESEEEKI